jgi:DNA-binding MarR family transcriptional regulator
VKQSNNRAPLKTKKRTGKAGKSADKERLRLWIRLLRTTRTVEAELRERLRTEFGSTLPRFDVMSALSRHGSNNAHGMKMSELSRMLMVSNGNVTGIVERLAEEGLLLREADPDDKRAARVKLTRKGNAEFERQAAAHQQWLNECLAGISAADSAEIAALLKQASVHDNLR